MGGGLGQGRELVHAGSFVSLEGALWRELARVREAEPLAPVLVLVPTNLLRRHLAAVGARRGGLLNVHFLTLLDLARQLGGPALAAAGKAPLPRFADEVVARAVCRGGEAGYFASLAGRPGFHRALLATVDDLREAGAAPADLARAAERVEAHHPWLAPRLRDLHALWHAYERRLAELGLHDRCELMAAAALAAGADRWLALAPALLVYGFYDLNELQRRLVAACATGRHAVAFFPCEPEGEAFAYARPTFQWLLAQGFEPRGDEAEPEPALPAELAALQRGLFEPVGDAARDPTGELRILSAPDEVREVHAVVQAAVAAARRGRPLARVGILLRKADPYAALFAEECQAGGLGAYLHAPPPLSASRAGRSLLLLLRLLGSELLRSEVMDFVTYADVPFEELVEGEGEGEAASPGDWDGLSRAAGVVKGAEQWRDRLDRLRRQLEAEQAAGEAGVGERLASLAGFARFMAALVEALASVPGEGTWSELVGGALGLFRRLVRDSEERGRVEAVVAELARLDATGEPADAATLARLAREALEAESSARRPFGSCGPVVVDLMEGRGLPFDVVCVPGLVEKQFPSPAHTDPLLSDRERRVLASAGLALPRKGERAREERLLFRLAVGAGCQEVVLSYPRIEPSRGRERVPSHFVLRAVEAATGRRCTYASLEGFAGLERLGGLGFAPAEPEASWREAEYDLAVVQRALARRRGGEVSYLTAVCPTFAPALRAQRLRWGESRFTEYDGVLTSEPALAALAKTLGSPPWTLSASDLEGYATCPFRYFLERLLGVRPVEEPETVRRLAAVDRGKLLHRILHRALSRAKAEGRLPLKAGDAEQVLATAREGFAELEGGGLTGPLPLWELEQDGLEVELRRFVLDEASEAEGYVPAHFEVWFGHRPREGEGEVGSSQGAQFDLGGGWSLRIWGRIDRIDVRPDTGEARVLDYKTGSASGAPKPDSFAGGTALQLPLYLRAAQALLGDEATVAEALYRYVTARGGYRRVAFSRQAYEERERQLTAILATIVDGMSGGRFFAGLGEGACRGCIYRVVCGAPAVAAARRKTGDAAAEAFQEMREIP